MTGRQAMITRRPAAERGETRTDWLDSRHTFSFNRYYDPRHVGFGDLLVINEDRVAPGGGFGTHGHRDEEKNHLLGGGPPQPPRGGGPPPLNRPGGGARKGGGRGL